MSQPSSAVKAPSRRSASPHSRIAPAALFEPRCPTVTPRLPRWRPPRGWPAPRRTRSPRALDRGQDREVRAPAPAPAPAPSLRRSPRRSPRRPPPSPPRRPSARSSWRSTTPPCTRAWTSCTASTPRTRRCPWRAPPPPPVAATGLRAIDDALRRLAARRARVTVTSVDALHSAHGAVVVVVTGRAIPGRLKTSRPKRSRPGEGSRKPSFLAPQRNGFYVKNDLVRFLPPEPPEPPRSDVRLIGTTPSLSVKSGPGPTQPGPDAGPDAGPEKRARARARRREPVSGGGGGEARGGGGAETEPLRAFRSFGFERCIFERCIFERLSRYRGASSERSGRI